ncbi:MAG: hypothetical protein HWE14_01100 [Flavobacteriia bacterium]|nr:hypothetical protein [Flavobacteriia bacterium]
MYLHKLKRVAFLGLTLGFATQGWSQYASDSTAFDWRRGSFPKEKPDEIYQLKVSGFYRFFGTNLQMDAPYLIDPNSGAVLDNRTLFIGDDSQLPNLLMNVYGRPNKKVSWGFDIFMFQFLEGNIGPTYSGQVSTANRPSVWDPLSGTRLGQSMGLNLGMNFYGSYQTTQGTFNVRLGGIHWFSMSDLTLASFRGYNRFTLTERNPWDPIGNELGVRYEQMYRNGDVYQDLRWGERAVQGIILEGINLPNGWSFAGLFGKTELNGGFLSIPNSTYGGKLRKTYGENDFISFNTINNTTWSDSLTENVQGFNMHTVEWKSIYPNFIYQVEIGAGRYKSGASDYPWGEAISAKVTATRNLLPIPIEVHYYRISPYVVNNNAIFWNTSLEDFQGINQSPTGGSGTQAANVLTPFSSSIVQIGQMTNNRTGLNLNTAIQLGKFNIGLGYGVSTEIEAFQNRITYSHFVNQLTRSRFWRWNFPNNVGPYGNYNKAYRDAYQVLEVTDDSLGIAVNPKKFTQMEVHAKYKTKIAHRNFYAFFLGRYYTAQPEFSILPVFSEDAYLRQYNSELEMFYELNQTFILNSYFGYERSIANYQTELNSETLRPVNQTGWGIGVGCDISLSKNAGLFFRHRWFSFEDTSFPLDQFSGQESSLELKIFF